MRLSTALAPFLLLATSNAFTPHPSRVRSSTAIQMSGAPRVLTASDVISKSNAPAAPGEEEEIPKLFSEEIYADFQSALLKLEKRVKEGKGALSLVEVEEFELESGRIVEEMNAYLKDPEGMKKKIADAYSSSSGQVSSKSNPATVSTTHTIPNSQPPPVATAPKAVTPVATAPATPQPTNLSENEGPSYDGSGYGLARGTTNTYVIPGMESMSPEEYRAKLQETISARQAKRREESLKKTGRIGNASSQGYLDALSQGKNDDVVKVVRRSDSVSRWLNEIKDFDDEVKEKEAVESSSSELLDDEVFEEHLDESEAPELVPEDEVGDATNEATTNIAPKISDASELPPNSEPGSNSQTQEERHKAESMTDFSSSLKQGRAIKELSRKSEWQTDIKTAEPEPPGIERSATHTLHTLVLQEEKKWFNEKRQRPVPSSKAPQFAQVRGFVGDTRQPSKPSVAESRLGKGWYNEKRVRPAPNSESLERPVVSDRFGAEPLIRQSLKSADSQLSLNKGWYNEKRVRPAPNSDSPDRPVVSERTGAEPSTRQSLKSADSQLRSEKGWYNEKRVRPAPNSESPERAVVSDRTGAQPVRQPSKSSTSQSQSEIGWYNEKRVRPAPNSESPERVVVFDRTGAQPVRQPSKSSDLPHSQEGWYNEKRVRPSPNSDSPERQKVFDRTGAELNIKSLTENAKQPPKTSDESQPPVNDTWYIEPRVRPIPITESPQHPKVYDRTGSESESTPKGAPLNPSLLRSLLNTDPPRRSKPIIHTYDKPIEINHWWKDDISRPKDFVTHSTPINTSYEKKPDHPKNYGDMTLELEKEEVAAAADDGGDDGVDER